MRSRSGRNSRIRIKRMIHSQRRKLKWLVVAFCVIAVPLGLMFAFALIANEDLYGRAIDTQTAVGVGRGKTVRSGPTVRLILHKLLADENAIEASLMIIGEDGDLPRLISEGKTKITAELRDGSSLQPYGILSDVTLDHVSAKVQPGVNSFAVQSQRFLLPAMSSVSGFPYDDLKVRPIVDVRRDEFYTGEFKLEIQKAMPGRVMELSDKNIVDINLTRSPTEKVIVLASSGVFIFLSVILVIVLFDRSRGLSSLEELLAVGGYLVAAAGFREVLGVSRMAGASALEMIVIGVPLAFLSVAVGISFMRGRLSSNRQQRQPSSNHVS